MALVRVIAACASTSPDMLLYDEHCSLLQSDYINIESTMNTSMCYHRFDIVSTLINMHIIHPTQLSSNLKSVLIINVDFAKLPSKKRGETMP